MSFSDMGHFVGDHHRQRVLGLQGQEQSARDRDVTAKVGKGIDNVGITVVHMKLVSLITLKHRGNFSCQLVEVGINPRVVAVFKKVSSPLLFN